MPPWNPDNLEATVDLIPIEDTNSDLTSNNNNRNDNSNVWKGFFNDDTLINSSDEFNDDPFASSTDLIEDHSIKDSLLKNELFNYRDEVPNPPSGAIPTTSTIKCLQKAINSWAKHYGFTIIRN